MELKGNIGTVGTYDVSASLDAVAVSLGVSIPIKVALVAWLTKEVAAVSSSSTVGAIEKEALQAVLTYVQAQP